MSRLLFLSAAAALLSTVTALPTPPNRFSGRGQIWVLNSTDLLDALPSDRIGCLDAHGALTLNHCAVFTQLDQAPHTLSSRIGSCGFRDENMPTNKDSYYGRDSHAWACQPDDAAVRSPPDENYYTLNGLPYPFICNGNINCIYDIKTVPSREDDGAPVWQYYWGSEEMQVAPGHLRTMWLWVPVASPNAAEDESD